MAASIAAVIDLESTISIASKDLNVPVEEVIILTIATFSKLPSIFDRQRKQGFSIPLNEWLKAGAFRELFWQTLSDSRGLWKQKTIQALLRGQDQGRSNAERLFGLVQLELWRRHYKVTL